MQVSFYLRKDKVNKAGQMPVRMLLTFNGERIRTNVKEVKVLERDWKEREQRIKVNKKSEPYNYHIEYNKNLDELDNRAKKLFRYMMLNDINPTKEYVTLNLKSGLGAVSLSREFLPSFDEFIKKGKNVKTDGTLRRYGTALNFYKNFSKFTGYELRFDSINFDFFEKFRDYAFQEKQTLNNYFSKLVSVLKTFMNWSHERGYHNNLEYKKFKAPEQEIEVIYLTMDELMRLYKHDFHNRRLEHTRDTYCFGCFTGLRFSDLSQLRCSNIYEDYILLNIKKTRSMEHKIPLNRFAKEILSKYENTVYEPLPIISDVRFNFHLKECCRFAKITTPTTITRFIGKKRLDKTLPKWKLITSHTARKTFVTNSLVLGMKEMVVRNITGHRKEESFRRYVKIAEDLKKSEMDNTWGKVEINEP